MKWHASGTHPEQRGPSRGNLVSSQILLLYTYLQLFSTTNTAHKDVNIWVLCMLAVNSSVFLLATIFKRDVRAVRLSILQDGRLFTLSFRVIDSVSKRYLRASKLTVLSNLYNYSVMGHRILIFCLAPHSLFHSLEQLILSCQFVTLCNEGHAGCL